MNCSGPVIKIVGIGGGGSLILNLLSSNANGAVEQIVHPNTSMITISVIDAPMEDTFRVTIVAAGYDHFGVPARSPRRRSDDAAPLHSQAELRAAALLQQVLPGQAERYHQEHYIEVPSALHPERLYRIHRGPGSYQTEVVCRGKTVARCCLALLDPQLPPTDRVLSEFFLLRGDERHYLRTVNLQQEKDGSPQVTVSQRVARRLGSLADDTLHSFVRSCAEG